jgi:mannitol-1-phosphate 5-dehydrogenase
MAGRTYVGFGFGAIQAGLFLYEASRSGAFGRLVVAEVLPEVVAAVRRAGGSYTVNIAHSDRVEQALVGPVELLDPAVAADRRQLVGAIAEAAEIGTAVPSIRHYTSSGEGSLHRLLAAGLRVKVEGDGPRAVIYTAENHKDAAEILTNAVLAELPGRDPAAIRRRVCFLNTVIGKMSGVISDPDEIQVRGLAPTVPGSERAFLVEAFNRILISQVRFAGRPFRRGIAVFEEKPDLLPFEEAKLYGHNATHATAAYLAMAVGARRIADLAGMPGLLPFLRAAFIEESGKALIHRYAGFDPLFTPAGYAAYADDLLARMVNPFLGDTAERVGRDPERKLGWEDRLIGTLRMCLQEGVAPNRYAVGAAAALIALCPNLWSQDLPFADLLLPLWPGVSPESEEFQAVLQRIARGLWALRNWRAGGFQSLDSQGVMPDLPKPSKP